jgi:hypothetical protein
MTALLQVFEDLDNLPSYTLFIFFLRNDTICLSSRKLLVVIPCPFISDIKESLGTGDCPMRRNLSKPFNPAVLHRHIGIYPFGDGMTDDGAALFLQ